MIDPVGATGTDGENLRASADLEQRLAERAAELEKAKAEVRRLSITDDLTGLHNRRGFLLLAEQELKVLRRSRRRALVLAIDVDTNGRGVGDQLLVDVASMLRRSFRDEDVIARIGGDQMAVFIPDASDQRPIAARLQEQARRRGDREQVTYRIELSIGAAVYDPASPRELGDLFADADAAMHEQKRIRHANGNGASPTGL